MKPFQEIEAAVIEAQKAILKLSDDLQKIADTFTEKTGGVITDIHLNFVEATEYGDETKRTLFSYSDINVSK